MQQINSTISNGVFSPVAERSGATAMAEALKIHQVEKAFAVVGNQINDLVIALDKVGIEIITCRHEGNAAMMAEAYARSSGHIGVVLTIPGPGVANALVGLLEAYTACTPLLLLTAVQPSRSQPSPHDKLFHGMDHVAVTRPMAGHSATIASRLDFEVEMKRSFATLKAGRPKPVLLELDMGWMKQTHIYDLTSVEAPPQTQFRPEDIQHMALMVSESRRGVIVGGRGILAAKAGPAFQALVERLNMPVLTTTLGKGALSERHPLHMGKLYEPCCRHLLADADLVVAIGCRFSQVDTDDWNIPLDGVPIIHMDADKAVFNNEYRASISASGDLSVMMNKMRDLVPPNKSSAWRISEIQAQTVADRSPRPFMAECFNELLQEEDTLVVDVHEQGYPMVEHFEARRGERFLFPGLSLALGYGIPAAIGARFAQSSGRVICFSGDGGFMMSCQELATVAKYGLDILFVIVDDAAYGTIKSNQTKNHGVSIGVDIENPDFELLARSFGFPWWKVESLRTLPVQMRAALEMSGPRVLVVPKSLLPQ